MHKPALSLGAVLLVSAALAAQSPLTTLFTSNNGGSVGGCVFFDLHVNVGIAVTQLDVNLGSAANTVGSIDVYTVPSTYLGNEANMSAWTLAASGPATAAGLNLPTPVTLNAPLILSPGNYGIALVGVGHSHRYTNGTGSNQTYSTAELTLNAGAAMNVAFSGSPFTPRVVNCSIYYSIASGFASATPYGKGCNDRAVSFYETWPAGSFDLGSSTGTNVVQMVPSGGGYVVTPGAPAWFTPVAANLGLADDALSGPLSLPFAFPYSGGSTNSIIVESNGNVWMQMPAHTSFICDTSASALLTRGPVFSALYNDFDPSPAGGGTIHFDVDPSNQTVYVTWLAIPIFNATPPSPRPTNSLQVALHSSGLVEYRYQQIDTTGSWTSSIVGFSPGAGNRDPGPIDISASMPFVTAADLEPLTLSATGRPLLGNSTFALSIAEIPSTSAVGALLLGFTQFNPGLPLAVLGMPGCSQYTSIDAQIITPFLATPTAVPLPIPNLPVLTGVHVFAQAGAFDPTANALGVLASNGVDLSINAQ